MLNLPNSDKHYADLLELETDLPEIETALCEVETAQLHLWQGFLVFWVGVLHIQQGGFRFPAGLQSFCQLNNWSFFDYLSLILLIFVLSSTGQNLDFRQGGLEFRQAGLDLHQICSGFWQVRKTTKSPLVATLTAAEPGPRIKGQSQGGHF